MIDGKQIAAALWGIRRLHRQVAMLLQTANGLAQDRGWKVRDQAQAVAFFGYGLDRSVKWMPEFVNQWYECPGDDTVVAHVTVVLCPRDEHRGVPPFEQPLISVGWLRFRDRAACARANSWLSKRILWTNVPRDGTWHHWPLQNPDAQGVTEAKVMAIPMVEVDSTEDLVRKVIDTLAVELPVPSTGAAGPNDVPPEQVPPQQADPDEPTIR